MAELFNMPKLGMDMEEGIVVRWLKAEGDTVEKGEPLAEIETDKSSVEVESPATGTVLKLFCAEDEALQGDSPRRRRLPELPPEVRNGARRPRGGRGPSDGEAEVLRRQRRDDRRPRVLPQGRDGRRRPPARRRPLARGRLIRAGPTPRLNGRLRV